MASEAGFGELAVIGPGRIGRQIALAFAAGSPRVHLVDVGSGRGYGSMVIW